MNEYYSPFGHENDRSSLSEWPLTSRWRRLPCSIRSMWCICSRCLHTVCLSSSKIRHICSDKHGNRMCDSHMVHIASQGVTRQNNGKSSSFTPLAIDSAYLHLEQASVLFLLCKQRVPLRTTEPHALKVRWWAIAPVIAMPTRRLDFHLEACQNTAN